MKGILFFTVLTAAVCALLLRAPAAGAAQWAESLGEMAESLEDSLGNGLKNLGEELNRANDAFLNDTNPNRGGYEDQMRRYRRIEAERTAEMSEASGASAEYVRKLRDDGLTWEEIAQKYNINLTSLPAWKNSEGY